MKLSQLRQLIKEEILKEIKINTGLYKPIPKEAEDLFELALHAFGMVGHPDPSFPLDKPVTHTFTGGAELGDYKQFLPSTKYLGVIGPNELQTKPVTYIVDIDFENNTFTLSHANVAFEYDDMGATDGNMIPLGKFISSGKYIPDTNAINNLTDNNLQFSI